MKTANWFWNGQERRIRAGWRVLFQIILTAGFLYGLYYSGVFSTDQYWFARMEVTLLVIALSILGLCVRFLDRRKFNDLGINFREVDWWIDFTFGVLLGIVQAVVFLGIAQRLEWITIDPFFQSLSGELPLSVSILLDLATIFVLRSWRSPSVLISYEISQRVYPIQPGSGGWDCWLGRLQPACSL